MDNKWALEEHLSTPENNEFWDAAGESARNGAALTAYVERHLLDIDERVALMDKTGIERVILVVRWRASRTRGEQPKQEPCWSGRSTPTVWRPDRPADETGREIMPGYTIGIIGAGNMGKGGAA